MLDTAAKRTFPDTSITNDLEPICKTRLNLASLYNPKLKTKQ